ncbi:orf108 [Trichoplusia ni single nucleopolyhedrovirus]|uniref:Orf108 n=1 Tax=Trichoplusia ni single nucleopolyhedrovirus TaxID=332054 RepID=Q461V8_9ABAC|nr:orf108 [Trichoplusia ni single nucleopolyhedrovirus]AAZ67478.1 orf108 [Trichoplusia ni single nucleopolyhedrovirus]
MSVVKKSYIVAEDKSFDVYIYINDDGEPLFKAKDVAVALDFADTDQAIRKNVDDCDKITWSEIPSPRRDLVVPPNWHPRTLFLNESGLYSLMLASKKPQAKLIKRWVTSEVLPSIRKTGKYELKEQQTSTEVVNYDKKLADAQIEALQLKLQLSEANATIAKLSTVKDLTISEIKRNYETQMAEYKEREYRMQLVMKDMATQANMSMTQFAVNALLAKDNIDENEKLRQTLTSISGRVVPALADRPDKEEYITGYERTVDGRKRIRIGRNQYSEIKQHDRAIQKYQEEATSSAGINAKRPRLTTNLGRYAWLKDSKKFLQLKCANPVTVWLKVRTDQPHMFYGLRYTNKARTEMEVMNENELRDKYQADIEMCERNKNIHSKMIKEFNALGFTSEDDCVAKCLTPSIEAKERINTIVEGIVEGMNKDLVPSTPQRRHSNAGETYSAEQVVHTMNNCQNFFVKNVFNIKFFNMEQSNNEETPMSTSTLSIE